MVITGVIIILGYITCSPVSQSPHNEHMVLFTSPLMCQYHPASWGLYVITTLRTSLYTELVYKIVIWIALCFSYCYWSQLLHAILNFKTYNAKAGKCITYFTVKTYLTISPSEKVKCAQTINNPAEIPQDQFVMLGTHEYGTEVGHIHHMCAVNPRLFIISYVYNQISRTSINNHIVHYCCHKRYKVRW